MKQTVKSLVLIKVKKFANNVKKVIFKPIVFIVYKKIKTLIIVFWPTLKTNVYNVDKTIYQYFDSVKKKIYKIVIYMTYKIRLNSYVSSAMNIII